MVSAEGGEGESRTQKLVLLLEQRAQFSPILKGQMANRETVAMRGKQSNRFRPSTL
jgi:hypothetical protein